MKTPATQTPTPSHYPTAKNMRSNRKTSSAAGSSAFSSMKRARTATRSHLTSRLPHKTPPLKPGRSSRHDAPILRRSTTRRRQSSRRRRHFFGEHLLSPRRRLLARPLQRPPNLPGSLDRRRIPEWRRRRRTQKRPHRPLGRPLCQRPIRHGYRPIAPRWAEAPNSRPHPDPPRRSRALLRAEFNTRACPSSRHAPCQIHQLNECVREKLNLPKAKQKR